MVEARTMPLTGIPLALCLSVPLWAGIIWAVRWML
jgi:hypothetical protein